MLKFTLWLFVGVLAWGFALSSVKCPDGNVCPDLFTCCRTGHGYSCCPYPKAVCCSDLTHCCPSGYRCNLISEMCEKKNQPWLNIPMVKKEAAEEPTPDLPVTPLQELKSNDVLDQKKVSVVYCDNYHYCPDGTTCCRHPTGVWFCCSYSPGRCCLDGYHCCPYGYDCDLTYTHCVRRGLMYPFPSKQALTSVPASVISTSEDKISVQETPMTALTEASSSSLEAGVIRCNDQVYCPGGTTCCKGSTGQFNCCPFPLGQCCKDSQHCCPYGYNCDPSSMSCRQWYSQVPSAPQEHAKAD